MAVFYGSEGNDTLFATSSNDTLYGFGGNDALVGYGGSDFLQGGAGADWLDGGDGIDTADYNGNAAVYVDLQSGRGYGGEAEGDSLLGIENVLGTVGYGDTLIGNGAANGLWGYGGNDYLHGLDGDDILSGMDGDDFLQGGSGADTLNGGAGIDTVDYNGTEGVYVDLEYGVGYGGEAEGDTLVDFENVLGTTGYRDVIYGSSAANSLSGFGGDDTLLGQGGDDVLSGMDGDDDLRGGAGADRLLGGAGLDIIRYEGHDAIYVDLSAGRGSGGEAEGDTLSEIESVAGGSGNDVLVGSATGNILLGSFGDDTLWGLDGDDDLRGGDGSDRMAGGRGADMLRGEGGADTFVCFGVDEAPIGEPVEQILDFSHAEGDRIDLAAVDADVWVEGDQAFTFIGTSDFTGHAGELIYRIIGYSGSSQFTQVVADVDGDGAGDFEILLTGAIGFVAADFVL